MLMREIILVLMVLELYLNSVLNKFTKFKKIYSHRNRKIRKIRGKFYKYRNIITTTKVYS